MDECNDTESLYKIRKFYIWFNEMRILESRKMKRKHQLTCENEHCCFSTKSRYSLVRHSNWCKYKKRKTDELKEVPGVEERLSSLVNNWNSTPQNEEINDDDGEEKNVQELMVDDQEIDGTCLSKDEVTREFARIISDNR